MPLHIQTPLIESASLGLRTGRSIWLKLEALQPPGSFKLRGVGHACEVHRSRGAKRFVSSSGGNAGLAVAYAGRRLSVPVTVVVPTGTTETAVSLLRQQDADVVVHGSSWQEANELALSLIGPDDAFIHPFDDPLLWQGHATIVDEVVRSGLDFDAVLLSVGGGGLLCGVAEGLHRNGRGNVAILAVETKGAASFRAATRAGHLVTLEAITSVASSLGAKRVCERSLQWAKDHPIQSILVSDRSALSACERFLGDHRILVEPACGASLALAYENHQALTRYRTVLVVVCGGATTTIDQIRHWSKREA